MKVTKENLKVYYNGNLVRIKEDIIFKQTTCGCYYYIKFRCSFYEEEFDKLIIELSKFVKNSWKRDNNIAIFVNDRKMATPFIQNISIDHRINECIVTYTVTIHSDPYGRPDNYNYKIIPYDPADYPGLLDLGEKK